MRRREVDDVVGGDEADLDTVLDAEPVPAAPDDSRDGGEQAAVEDYMQRVVRGGRR